MYQPLTQEQYTKAREQFSNEQIIEFEKQRKLEEDNAPRPKPQLLKYREGSFMGNLGEVATGVAKGELATIRGIGALGNKFQGVLDQTVGRGINAITGKGFEPLKTAQGNTIFNDESPMGMSALNALTPRTGWEQLGYTGERIAEFLALSGAVNQAARVVGLGAKGAVAAKGAGSGLQTLANLSGQSLVQGAAGSTITAGQTGKYGTEAVVNGLISAAFPFLAYGAGQLGKKITESSFKASPSDIKKGFKIDTIDEFKLHGPPQEALKKTQVKLTNLSQELNNKLAERPDLTFDVDSAYQRTVERLGDRKHLIRNVAVGVDDGLADLKNMLDKSYKALGEQGIEATPKTIPIDIAQDIKQAAGTRPAWMSRFPDKTADSIDVVYKIFYDELKTGIEKTTESAGIKGIGEINKSISKLIPVQSVLIRAAARSANANVISLTDFIGLLGTVLDPRALAVYGANAALKNPAFAAFLYTASQSSSAIPSVLKGAVSSFKEE